ncbi:MAG: SLBB domain-containing protein [Breznakibacter sp.]
MKISTTTMLRLTISLFVCLSVCTLSLSQSTTTANKNVDPQTVNVSNLTDQQILTLMREIEKRGLSESEAITLARARGMSQSQIDQLRQRMNELKLKKLNGEIEGKAGSSMDNTMLAEGEGEDMLSVKIPVDSAKTDIRIFGFQFFNNEKLTFEPNVKIPVSPSYVVGPGDQVLIDVWGASQKSYELEIDRNGMINIIDVGPISVGGLTLENAKNKIIQRLSSIYSDLNSSSPRTFANVHLGTIKAIKVNVVGEVFAPGTYTLPGTATAFNALYLAGGPNVNGSFRDIHVIRDGQVVNRLDVYDFLINGNGLVNMPLRDNDVVMVPTYLNRVRVGGQFKRNGIFEAKENEKVSDLIKFAGGFTEKAYTGRLELYRNTSKQRQFKNVLDKEYVDFFLQSGDSIYAGDILERFENKVTIEGAVYRPGNYELTEGLTLSQLIGQADGLREDAFMNRALLTRLNKDLSLQSIAFKVSDIVNGSSDISLEREDIVTISSINDLREMQTIKISGEVQLPGEYDYRDNMTLSDLVFIAGGFRESATEASVEIVRRLSYDEANDFGNKVAHVYQFSISRDLRFNEQDARFAIRPFDQVFVRRAPSFAEAGAIRIIGEVKYAGEFGLSSKKERLSDIIKRAGGLSPDASPESAMLTRKVEVSNKIKRLRAELLMKDSTLTFSDMDFEVVGINLKRVMENQGSREDIFIQPGDELVIPREIQTVKISGEVLNPISVAYQKGTGMRNYIDQGGGFGVKAKRGRVYVIHANGVASSTKSFFFFRSYPTVTAGAEIVVPQRPEREGIPPSTWISLAGTLASISLTIATIANMKSSE